MDGGLEESGVCVLHVSFLGTGSTNLAIRPATWSHFPVRPTKVSWFGNEIP